MSFDTERIYIVTGNIEEHGRCPDTPETMTDPAECGACEALGEKLTNHLEALLDGEFEFEEINFSPGRAKKDLTSLRNWMYQNYPEVLRTYDRRDSVPQPASRQAKSSASRKGGILDVAA